MALALADLHTHTTASDGTSAPAENVRLAREAGLAAVAITDHDTMAGVEEALEEGRRLGITVVPGVEISTSADGADIHVLGYGLDWRDKGWNEKLESLRLVRNRRNERIIERLNRLGIDITLQEAKEAAARDVREREGASVGRPHIAELLVRKGIVGSMREAFDRYLGAGCPAYVGLERISPFEAIGWIREAGGKSVLAHPGLYRNDALVEEIARGGVDGIEVFHSDHGAEDRIRYAAVAERHRLLVTGGSDYHGRRGGTTHHGELGSVAIDAGVVKLLQSGSGRKPG